MAGQLTSLTIFFIVTTRAVNWASPPCTDDCAPFIPGAVAYWPMTMETNGSDLSRNNNHATCVGLNYTDGPNGEDHGAVHFYGSSNSFASVINSPSMQIGKYPGFSFSGFVRVGIRYTSAASLIDWSSDDGNSVYIIATSQKKILLKLHPINDTRYNHAAEFPNLKLVKGAWHFIGVSYDKATGKATAFKDGNEEVKQLDKSIVAGTNKTEQVGLGIDLSKPSEFSFKGDMSCMMVFRHALTADDFNRVMEFCRTTQSTQAALLPNITVLDIAATRANVSWTKSPGIFSEYNITIERRQSSLDQEIANPPFIPSSASFLQSALMHLVPGATYRVRVWHMQRDLVGGARYSAWFETEQLPAVKTDSIIFSEITITFATVSWKEASGNHDGYVLCRHFSPTTGGAKVEPSTVPRGTTTTFLRNLSPGSSYSITIRTKVGSMESSSSSKKSFQTPDDRNSSQANIISVVVAVIFIVLLASVAGVTFYCRRSKKKSRINYRSRWYQCNCLRRNKGRFDSYEVPDQQKYGDDSGSQQTSHWSVVEDSNGRFDGYNEVPDQQKYGDDSGSQQTPYQAIIREQQR